MERKVAFVEGDPFWLIGGEVHTARHTEVLVDDELSVSIEVKVFFSSNYNVQFATGRISYSIFHYGQRIQYVDGVDRTIKLPSPKKIYAKSDSVSIGGETISFGFSGKAVSRRNWGWLPKFFHLKIETTK